MLTLATEPTGHSSTNTHLPPLKHLLPCAMVYGAWLEISIAPFEATIDSEATVWELLTVYVPVPPVPVPRAVITVPAVTPVPVIPWPTLSCGLPLAPAVTAVTVSVVPAMLAVMVSVAYWYEPVDMDRKVLLR